MAFAFSVEDPVAAFLERFGDAATVLSALGIDLLHDLARPIGADRIGEDQLDRLAVRIRAARWEEDDDWTSANLEELVAHLSVTHHRYLTSELPRLRRLARRLAATGNRDALEFDARLDRLGDGLLAHLEREEAELFPACRAIARASSGAPLPDWQRLRIGVHDLEAGHEHLERELPVLRSFAARLEDDLLLPGLRPALVAGLDSLAADLRQHHYEEEECLLPAALHSQELLSRPILRRWAEDGAP